VNVPSYRFVSDLFLDSWRLLTPSVYITMPAKKTTALPPGQNKKASGEKQSANALFEKKSKNLGIGGTVRPKTDLGRYVKWPKYVRVQRQRKVLSERLKIPPAVNIFTKSADKNLTSSIFKILMKYRPAGKALKKERLIARAESESKGSAASGAKPCEVKYGINHISYLVEHGDAKLVVIAKDVSPIELVIWLPLLCKKMDVPFVIVKGKSLLGNVVNKKCATALAITEVRPEDKHDFVKIAETCKANYNDKMKEFIRQQGGQVMGVKAVHKRDKRAALIALEEAKRNQVM